MSSVVNYMDLAQNKYYYYYYNIIWSFYFFSYKAVIPVLDSPYAILWLSVCLGLGHPI